VAHGAEAATLSLPLSLSIRSVEWLTVLAGGSGAGRAAVTCRGRASPATIIQKVRRSFPCLPAGRKRAPPSYAFGSDPITVYTCVVSTEASAPQVMHSDLTQLQYIHVSYPLTSMLIIGCICLLLGPPLIPFSFSISCNLDVLN